MEILVIHFGLVLNNAQALELHDTCAISNAASDIYTMFPWFLAYCAKACEIIQCVQSVSELHPDSFAPLRDITSTILNGEIIHAEQFISGPSRVMEKKGKTGAIVQKLIT